MLVVDDYGQIGRYAADLILDQNPSADEEAYRSRPAHCDLLLGTRYALLRREVVVAGRNAAVRPQQPSLVVSFGGVPSPALLELADKVAGAVRADGMSVTILRGSDDVVPALRAATMALATAGSTCWELCYLQLPAVLVVAAENQRPIAAALADRGAAIDLGWADDVEVGAVVSAVLNLAEDDDRRKQMATTGRQLVDGRGAVRVVEELRGLL
jgi:spore coat polysaccharide biosynthesis predicted glycosyltransferase SpsG